MANFTENFTSQREACDHGRENRHQFFEKMRGEVKQLAEETQGEMGRFHAERKAMSDQLKSELAGFAGDLRTGGKIFLGG